jgi:hypothetical protein
LPATLASVCGSTRQFVIIEGINLGQTYRNQFAAAVDQNHGDIDKVITNWRVEPQTDAKVAGNTDAKSAAQ